MVQMFDLTGRSLYINDNVNSYSHTFHYIEKEVVVLKILTVDGNVTTKKVLLK